MKCLVAYFSRTGENMMNGTITVIEKGNTEIVAEKIQKYTGADIFKIEPVDPYPFNYQECVARASEEGLVDYKNRDFSIDDYDVIFLGFPNWYRSYPRVVATFVRDHNFEGKTILPFCTNEEGAFGIGESELRSSTKGANIKNGFVCRGYLASMCDEELKKWLSANLNNL